MPTRPSEAPPPVYLDECVDYNLVEALRERGFSVSAARDEGTIQVEDAEQLAFAVARGWMIMTHNGRHFRVLHRAFQQQGRSHSGIIVLPERPPFERLVIRAAMMLTWIETMPPTPSGYFTWGKLQEQLEAGDRLPGFTEAEVRLALGRL